MMGKMKLTQRIGSKDTSGKSAAKTSACLIITVAAFSTGAEDGGVTVARKVKFADPPVRRVRVEMGRNVLETWAWRTRGLVKSGDAIINYQFLKVLDGLGLASRLLDRNCEMVFIG
jgi:hypothetical protein